jgi:hypothetical protein
MSKLETSAAHTRLDRLEIECRRLKAMLAVTAVGLLAVLLMAQSRGDPARDNVILRDSRGVERAALSIVEHGPALFLNDEAGKPRVVLGLTTAGSYLKLLGPDGRTSAEISALADGAAVSVGAPDGSGAALLGATGKSGVVASDTKGRPRARVGLTPKSNGLTVISPEGTVQIELATTPDHLPYLSLNDTGGKPRVEIVSDADGTTRVGLGDKDGRKRGVFIVLPNGSAHLSTADRDGKVLWSAP